MHFTVWPQPHQTYADVLALARQAESAGWYGIRFGDGFGDDIEAPVDAGGPALECWATLAAIAVSVPRLRLEAVVSAQRHRHPAVVTKQAVTVDQLSGGRVVLGLIADQVGGDEAQAQGARSIEGQREPVWLGEVCEVVQSLVGRDRTTRRGRYYRLREAPLEPKPLQRPLPLLTWGDGGGASARLAARFAHSWNVTGTPAQVRDQVAELRAACDALGRNPTEVTVSASADLPATTEARVAALREYAASGVEEWIVSDRVLGDGRPQRLAGLVHIMADVAPALA